MRTASVAAVFRDGRRGSSPELLFIRRPERRGDRWSGNVAFPGGLVQPGDRDALATAVREAREEVGLELGAPVGRLSDLLTAEPGRIRPMRVVPYVFRVADDVALAPDPREVAAAFWVPWPDVAAHREERTTKRIAGVPIRVAVIRLAEGTLWGLTLMMVRELERIERASAPR